MPRALFVNRVWEFQATIQKRCKSSACVRRMLFLISEVRRKLFLISEVRGKLCLISEVKRKLFLISEVRFGLFNSLCLIILYVETEMVHGLHASSSYACTNLGRYEIGLTCVDVYVTAL